MSGAETESRRLFVSDLAGGILIRWIDIIVSTIGAIIVMAIISVLYWRRV